MEQSYKLVVDNREIGQINLNTEIEKGIHTKILGYKNKEIEKSQEKLEEVQELFKELKEIKLVVIDRRKITINNFTRVLSVLIATLSKFEVKNVKTNKIVYQPLKVDEITDSLSEIKIENSERKTENEKSAENSEESKPVTENTLIHNGNQKQDLKEETTMSDTDKMEKVVKNVGAYKQYKNDMTMEEFIDLVESRCDFYEVTNDENKNKVLRTLLAGHGAGKIVNLTDNKNKNLADTKALLKLTIDGTTKKPWMSILERLNAMKVNEFGSLSAYFQEFCTKAAELGDKVNVDVQIQAFIQGLPRTVADYCKTQDCKSLTDCYEKATILYREKNDSFSVNRSEFDQPHWQGNNSNRGRGSFRGRSSSRNRGSGRGGRGRGRSRGQSEQGKRSVQCYFCEKFGHYQYECQSFIKAQEHFKKSQKSGQ